MQLPASAAPTVFPRGITLQPSSEVAGEFYEFKTSTLFSCDVDSVFRDSKNTWAIYDGTYISLVTQKNT